MSSLSRSGYHEDAGPRLFGEYTSSHSTNPAPLLFLGDSVNLGEQSVARGDPEICARNWVATAYPFPVRGPYLPHDSDIPLNPTYDTAAVETAHGITGGVGSTLRQHATQLLPVSCPHNTVHDYPGGGTIGHTHLPYGIPAIQHNQTDGYPPRSSVALSHGYELPHTVPPTFHDFLRAYLFYSTIQGSRPLLGSTVTPASLMVSSGADYPGATSALVSFPLGGMGNEEKAGLSQDSPPPDTNYLYSEPQHPVPQQIQRGLSSLPRLPDLRIVRQVMYKCGNTQRGWVKLPDIIFKVGGMDGIRLTDAMNAHFNGPDDRDELMFTNGEVGSTVSCRIMFDQFKGYRLSGEAKQISTSNYKKEKGRITKKRLAEYVAKCVKAYLEELKDAEITFPICFEDMILTRLVHVSKASFQPEIWYQFMPSSFPST